ncbi:MAG: RNA 2',3'-cyclic phosphodiesterase [Actinomycetota bacterium]
MAFDVPLAQRESLVRRVRDHSDVFPGARWTDVAGQHITLRFVGWVDQGDVPAISLACAQAARAVEPCDLRVSGLGAFPSERRVRVLWAGIEDPSGTTSRLAAELDARIGAAGFPGEERSFTPHLTLARMKVPVKVRQLPEIDTSDLDPFRLAEIVLYRSHLSPKGARYEALERFPLGSS